MQPGMLTQVIRVIPQGGPNVMIDPNQGMFGELLFFPLYDYCIVSIHLYSASCSAHQSEALPV